MQDWLVFAPNLTLSGAAGWWLGAQVGHPMIGMAVGGAAAVSALISAAHVPRHLQLLDRTPERHVYEQPVIAALSLGLMSVCGGIGLAAGRFIGALTGHPMQGQVWGLVGGAAVGLAHLLAEAEPVGEPGSHGNVHGDARFSWLKEILHRGVSIDPPNAVWLGQWVEWNQKKKKPVKTVYDLSYDKTASVMVFAPTGSGKFTASIAPTIFKNRQDNLVVFDPAGQACAVTARFRRSLGQRVVVINGFNELAGLLGLSSSVNPLGALASDEERLELECRAMSTILLPVPPNDAQPHFAESAQQIIEAGAVHLVDTHGTQATLPLLNSTLHLPPFERNELFQAMKHSIYETVRNIGNKYYVDKPNAETRKSVQDIFDTVTRATAFLGDPPMRRLFGGNDFSFKELKDPQARQRTTVYIVWPVLRADDYSKAAEILMSYALNSLMTYPASPSTLFIVDEMQAAIKAKGATINKIRDAFTNGRKVGLKVMTIAQDWGQFASMFDTPQDAYTLLNNAGMTQFFGTGAMDTVTQDLIIAQAGNRTIWAPSQNKPVMFTEGGHAEFLGWEEQPKQATGVPLLTRLDLREMHGLGLQIAFLMGKRFPVVMDRSHYFNMPEMMALADPDPYETSKNPVVRPAYTELSQRTALNGSYRTTHV
jgi:type IV secretory pathway TraG/TraD family ATPase VirD4